MSGGTSQVWWFRYMYDRELFAVCFVRRVYSTIGEWESRKIKEGLNRKVKPSLHTMFCKAVEFKVYVHGACVLGLD